MPIYEVQSDYLKPIKETSFAAVGIKEKKHLQRLLRKQINIIVPETLIIAEEFGDWDDSKRRIDLLGIDKDANLVVIELKRTDDGGHMELQALRYAAMVSTMTFDESAMVYVDYLRSSGQDADPYQELIEFLEWDEPDEDNFAKDIRIILVSAEFSKEITSSVLWLNSYGLDIRCVRMKPYIDGQRTFIDVQQVIPLPEATTYQVKVNVKNRQERISRTSARDLTKYDVTINGIMETHLAKRNAIFLIVKNLCSTGVKPERIAELIHWRPLRTFFTVEGTLSSQDFLSAAASLSEKQGKNFRPRRWFYEDDALIYSENKTYAFSKMWGAKWNLAMKILKDSFPEANISYRPCES